MFGAVALTKSPSFPRNIPIALAIVFLLAALLRFPCLAQGVTNGADSGAGLRKKLFVIERELGRKAPKAPASLSELVLGTDESADAESVSPPESDSEQSVKQNGASNDTNQDGKSDDADKNGAANDGSVKSEPDSVSFSLGDGKLTGYSFSSMGLDLSEVSGNAGLKLMLRSDSVDLKSLDEGGSMNDSTALSKRESFYGLKNFEQFKDLFAEEEKTKDYSVTGMGLNFETNGLSMNVLNFSRPPARKKAVFFGNDSTGPYKLSATNVIPGSEIVRVGGTKLERGAGYSISYVKGEITFVSEVDQNERVLVEYEVSEGGTSEPGSFTGFRVGTVSDKQNKQDQSASSADRQSPQPAVYRKADSGEAPPEDDKGEVAENSNGEEKGLGKFKWGPVSVENWGATYLSDSVIGYRSDGEDFARSQTDHQLMGFDGSLSIGKSTTIGLEAARSEGNKLKETGRFASETFTIADTESSDDNPMGPYQLDEDKLPAINESEEVRVNGELLERDVDYTLDLEYGTLRLKRTDLNLSELDTIAVTWRYLTEEDLTGGAGENTEGAASLFSMNNTWGKLKHGYSVERREADFMLVGGGTQNTLENEKQDFSWDGGKGFSVSAGRTFGKTLQDRSTGLTKSDRGESFSSSYKRGGLAVSLKKDNKEQFDSLAVHQTDTEKENQAADVSYDISENYHLSLKESRAAGSDLRSGAVSQTFSRDRSFQLKTAPTKNLNVDLGYGAGLNRTESDEQERESGKQSRDISVQYKPNKKLKLDFDMDRNEFSNSETAVDLEESDSATDTTTCTGNVETKWNIQYQPAKSTTLMFRNTVKRDDQINGTTDRNQTMFDVRHKLNANTDIQLQRTSTESGRPTQSQGAETDSVSVRTKAPWFDGTEITLKHDMQKSRMDILTESAMHTRNDSATDKIGVKCTPFWKGRNVSVEFSRKSGTQDADGQESTDEGETGWKAGVEIPFIRESYFTVSRESSRKTGGSETRQENSEVSLNGNPVKGVSIQLSYSSEDFTDIENPESSRGDSSFNVVTKMDLKW
jgi:hypothetical protein